MLLYIKQLIQLLLSPARGWEDISSEARTAEEIQRTGFYPWIGVTAVSQFVRLFYDHDATFVSELQGAIAIAGALFISLYLGRLFLDIILPKHVDKKINLAKVNIFSVYLIGMIGLYHIVSNLIPTSMTFLNFLPLLSLLIIFKAIPFVGVPEDRSVAFMTLSAIALMVIPIGVAALLTFLI